MVVSLTRYALGIWLLSVVPLASGAPLGTAFTYQGDFKHNGLPANGDFDMLFGLHDDAVAVSLIGSEVQKTVTVTDGRFTVELDFGTVFDGTQLWLQIDVRPDGDVNPRTPLTPRQEITATPYALFALGGPGSGGGFWAALGDNIYNTNTGRVGIGTTDPQAMLHLEGNGLPLILAANNWYAIRGTHSSTTGTFPGVWGDTNSESSNATGLRGIVNSTTPGAGSTGVLGQNNGTGANGIGVRGTHAGSGVGVRGDVTGGAGLAGYFVGGRTRIENTFATNSGGQLELKGPATGLGFSLGTLSFLDANDIVHGGITYRRSIVGDRLVFQTADADRMYIDQNGRVGLNDVGPLARLHVTEADLSLLPAALTNEDIIVEDSDAVLGLYSSGGGSYGSAVSLGETSEGNLVDKWSMYRNTTGGGSFLGFSYGPNANYGSNLNFVRFSSSGAAEVIVGPLAVGTVASNVPTGVKLAVDGKVLCEELEVQLSQDWPDYVFDEDYDLMPLEELEENLRRDKHLPGVPSAEEIATGGLEVGAMQARTMEKIEELTLYVLDLNRELKSVKKENAALKQRLAALEEATRGDLINRIGGEGEVK